MKLNLITMAFCYAYDVVDRQWICYHHSESVWGFSGVHDNADSL